MRTSSLALLSALAGCVTPRPAQDPTSWFDAGADYDVLEPVAFTDQNYGFTGDVPIGDLPVPDPFQTWFAPADAPTVECPDWAADPSGGLPAEITGVVTILPRYYFKTTGCVGDEKYYGCYFIQDASGGFFVLGDSKVAHFDNGDKVTLKVRAIKEAYDQLMIAEHDVVDVEWGPEPIYYETVATALGPEHISRVVRVEGTVRNLPTTFGEVYLDSDDGVEFKMALDQELSRRGYAYPVGARLRVTGPVLYSFSEYTVIVMRVGQVEVL